MDKVVIQEAGKNVPGFTYYPSSSTVEIFGRSIPENPDVIFSRLDDWLRDYFQKKEDLNVVIQLEYINSGSSKNLFESLSLLSELYNKGKKLSICWMYEEDDESILELGQYLSDRTTIPFEFKMVVE